MEVPVKPEDVPVMMPDLPTEKIINTSVIGSALTGFAITIWLTTVLYPHPAQKPQLAWALSALNFLMGLLSSKFDPGRIIAAFGLVLVFWCVLNLCNPYLRRVEDRAWIEARANGPIINS